MRQVVTFRKWSNSRALVIPAEVYRNLTWRVGDVLTLDVQDDMLIVRKVELPKGVRVGQEAGAMDGAAVEE